MIVLSDSFKHAIDDVVIAWPGVRPKQVFGHRGYVRGRKMFGFLVDDGIAVKVASVEDASQLYGREDVAPFMYSGMEMRNWAVLPVRSESDVDECLSWLQRGYESV